MMAINEGCTPRITHEKSISTSTSPCPQNQIEELRIEIFEKVNALGIGAQGLGVNTVLDIKIKDYPCHAAGKPSYIPKLRCNSSRSFPVRRFSDSHIQAPLLSDYPEVTWDTSTSKCCLDNITQKYFLDES
ncbi:hypothetical protein FQA39_LY19370 [Lamprigera yunnana]|nr:hypothetical protein FQA39_LY19370 [Lamprigera yunnana]